MHENGSLIYLNMSLVSLDESVKNPLCCVEDNSIQASLSFHLSRTGDYCVQPPEIIH